MLQADTTFVYDDALGRGLGVSAKALAARERELVGAVERVERAFRAGGLRWLALPERTDLADEVAAWRSSSPPFDDLLLFGIGGSALAALIFAALAPRGPAGPRLHLVETVDPARVAHLLEHCRPERTLVLGVSKSGTTLETAATFLIAEAWMERALGPRARERIVIVCDEEPNPLRARAERKQYACFPVPPGVGGRFSALCAVGLLPAALLGLDPAEPLRGARHAAARCLVPDLAENPALALAAAHALAAEAGRNVAVLWPYGEAVRPLGPWWVQLVGESLGKPTQRGPVGISPLAASGPADQHSLLQLLLEGPDDKLTVFLGAGASPGAADPRVPTGGEELTPVAGTSLGEILRAEQEATTFALVRAGRPAATVTLDDAGPAALGAALVTFEVMTAIWGELLGINAFDQPAVAFGKQAALARLLGKPADLVREMDAQRARPRRLAR
jgi:glucose-6-phosphate isomerase